MTQCSWCVNYGFREMIKKPYGYAGEIPCITCSRFSFVEDKYEGQIKEVIKYGHNTGIGTYQGNGRYGY